MAREICFFSENKLEELHVLQKVFLKDQLIEEWPFYFGFVIPKSVNTWQNIIQAAPASQMIPAKVLSGNMVIETYFFDNKTLLASSKVRIFYV